MAKYDHSFSVLVLDGQTITDWDDGTDVMQINDTEAKGALQKGTNRSIFVASGKKGTQLVIRLLQNSPNNKFLNDRMKSQDNNLKAHSPIQGYYKDTVNGDEIKLINGWFINGSNYVRGNGHNPNTWTIEFEAKEAILTEGSN